MRSRNKVATNPLLKKGHAHKSAKDYDRQEGKKKVKEAVERERSNKES